MADATYAEADVFFPGDEDSTVTGKRAKPDYTAAAAICRRCPIRDLCLQDALTETVQWGYRGGMTPEQRQALIKGNPPSSKYVKATDDMLTRRIALYDQGLNDRELGAALGMTHKAIIAWRKREKLPANSPAHTPHTPAQTAAKWEAYNAGEPDSVIAERAGCNPVAIRRWRMRQGLKVNPVRERVSA
jgi:hypothetical protein